MVEERDSLLDWSARHKEYHNHKIIMHMQRKYGHSLGVLFEKNHKRRGVNKLDRSCSKKVGTEGDDGGSISHLNIHYYSW